MDEEKNKYGEGIYRFSPEFRNQIRKAQNLDNYSLKLEEQDVASDARDKRLANLDGAC